MPPRPYCTSIFAPSYTGFSVNRFDYGISEAIGARPTMEDRSVVIQNLIGAPPDFYYGGEPKETLNELAMTTFAAEPSHMSIEFWSLCAAVPSARTAPSHATSILKSVRGNASTS